MTKVKKRGYSAGVQRYMVLYTYYNRKYESLICAQALRHQTKSGGGGAWKVNKIVIFEAFIFSNSLGC